MIRLIALCIPLFVFAQAEFNDPSQSATPFISTQISQLDGSQALIQYRAVRWDKDIFQTIQTDDNARRYVNNDILSKAVKLRSNVQLGIGTERLNPGDYQLGIMLVPQTIDPNTAANANQQSQLQFYFVGYDSNDIELFRIPVRMQEQAETASHLSIVFTPGITDRDFIVSVIYGKYILALKWRFTGIPTLNDNNNSDMPSLNVDPITGEPIKRQDSQTPNTPLLRPLQIIPDFVPPAGLNTYQRYNPAGTMLNAERAMTGNPAGATPTVKKKAGSGAFRRAGSKPANPASQ